MSALDLLYTPIRSFETTDPSLVAAWRHLVDAAHTPRGDLPPLTLATALELLPQMVESRGLTPPPPDPVTGARVLLADRSKLLTYPDHGLWPLSAFPSTPTPLCLIEAIPHLSKNRHPITLPSAPKTLPPPADLRLYDLADMAYGKVSLGTLGDHAALCRHISTQASPAPAVLRAAIEEDICALRAACDPPSEHLAAAMGIALAENTPLPAIWSSALGTTLACEELALPLLSATIHAEADAQSAGLWLFLFTSLV